VKFHKDHVSTVLSMAGLVVKADWLKGKSVSQMSRLFPYSEAMKMSHVCVSDAFDTWDDAFNHTFKIQEIRTGN
jgi:hypothetical protein